MGEIKINDIVYGTDNASSIIYKDTTVEEKLDTIPVFDPSDNTYIEANQYDYLTYGHIIDTLESSSSDKVLSANQGRILSEKIDNIDLSYLEERIAVNAESISNLDADLDVNIKNINNLNTKLVSHFIDATNMTSLEEILDNIGWGKGVLVYIPWDSPLSPDANTFIGIGYNKFLHGFTYIGKEFSLKSNEIETVWTDMSIPFKFGIDANGNYGYIKDGADTVTPFKKPCCYYNVYLTVHGTSAYGNISSSWHIDTSNWRTLILTGKMQDENNSSLVIKANSSSGTTIYTFSSRTNTTITIDISNYNSIFMQVICSRGLSAGAWGTYVGKIELN